MQVRQSTREMPRELRAIVLRKNDRPLQRVSDEWEPLVPFYTAYNNTTTRSSSWISEPFFSSSAVTLDVNTSILTSHTTWTKLLNNTGRAHSHWVLLFDPCILKIILWSQFVRQQNSFLQLSSSIEMSKSVYVFTMFFSLFEKCSRRHRRVCIWKHILCCWASMCFLFSLQSSCTASFIFSGLFQICAMHTLWGFTTNLEMTQMIYERL